MANVERVGDAVHRDRDEDVSLLAPLVAEAVALAPEDEVAAGSAATMRIRRSRIQATASSTVASTTGTVKSVPMLAFTASGWVTRTRRSVNTTADAPAPSAQRTIAPRLPASSMRSST